MDKTEGMSIGFYCFHPVYDECGELMLNKSKRYSMVLKDNLLEFSELYYECPRCKKGMYIVIGVKVNG